MNRIYKVIWSKTRNAYVVVSELAKSHGKSKREHGRHANPSTLEKGLVVACLSGGLLLGAPQSVGAAQTVDAGTTTNGDANTLAVGANSTANGKGSLAVGGGSKASGDTAVALAWGSQALSDYSIALGHSAHVGGSYTYVQDGSTSGIRGTAQNAIAIGNTAVANGKDDVVIGTNNTAETPTASYVETNKTGAYAQGGRVIVGHDNSINGRSGNSTAIGSANTINAVHGIALGQNVQVGQKAGATGTKADKTSVTLAYENSMGIGVNAKSLSSNSIALGNGAVAGNERTTDIDTDWNGKGAIAIGETAQATGYYSLGLGAENKSTDDRTVALGHGT
ncbi:ESPR-type extended signal peptide-containing protein [Mitsuokella multacida]